MHCRARGGMDCFVASVQNCFAILSRAPRNDGGGNYQLSALIFSAAFGAK
ncbi:hypothetical protein ABIE91_009092 [Bradyrhizobium elkanii]